MKITIEFVKNLATSASYLRVHCVSLLFKSLDFVSDVLSIFLLYLYCVYCYFYPYVICTIYIIVTLSFTYGAILYVCRTSVNMFRGTYFGVVSLLVFNLFKNCSSRS